MELKLHLDGSVEPFTNYLKNFLRIRESILLEIDTNQRAIVAKTYSDDHSSVRFASITLEDAKLSIVSDANEADRNGERIKAGILLQLKRFIQVIERFGSSVDSEGKSNFDIVITYDILKNKDNSFDYVATDISFISDILKMRMNGFRITEFEYLSDESFQGIFNVEDPVSIVVSKDVVTSIIKTSDIIKFDPRRDMLVFFVEGNVLYVKDKMDKNEQPNFVYKIGELDNTPNYPILMPLTRERFIKMLDKTEEDFRFILGHEPGDPNEVVRMLFDSMTSSTKIVIAGIKDN